MLFTANLNASSSILTNSLSRVSKIPPAHGDEGVESLIERTERVGALIITVTNNVTAVLVITDLNLIKSVLACGLRNSAFQIPPHKLNKNRR